MKAVAQRSLRPGKKPSASAGARKCGRTPEVSGDTLVVTKLDRIGRDSIDVQATVELCAGEGIRLIVLQLGNLDLTSSSGGLMVKVLAAVADFERELIFERTRAGQARAREAGTHMGVACLGWGWTITHP